MAFSQNLFIVAPFRSRGWREFGLHGRKVSKVCRSISRVQGFSIIGWNTLLTLLCESFQMVAA
jgi:hypothetical protein